MARGMANFPAVAALVLLLWGCEEPVESGMLVTSPNIASGPFYFSLANSAQVTDIPDVTFKLEGGFAAGDIYIVELNSPANVAAWVETSGDFATAMVDSGNPIQFDAGTEYVIGNNWMDLGTHDPTDNRISANSTFYFIRTADYAIVKFRVMSATPAEFIFQYATLIGDTVFATITEKTVAYSADAPTHFDFSQNRVVTPGQWHMGVVALPGSVSLPFMPAILWNYGAGTRVAVINSQTFGEVNAAPANPTWLEESDTNRPTTYGGTHEILSYRSSDQTVYLSNAHRVYIVDLGTDAAAFFKLQFIRYDTTAGTIEIEYAAL